MYRFLRVKMILVFWLKFLFPKIYLQKIIKTGVYCSKSLIDI